MKERFTILAILGLLMILVISSVFGIEKGKAQEELTLFVKEKVEKPKPGPRYAPGELIVKFKEGVTEQEIDDLEIEQEAKEEYESPFTHGRRWKVPPARTVEEWEDFFDKHPLVEYAEPNYYAYATMVPNDTYYNYQWHFDDDNTNNPDGASSNPYGGSNGGGIRMEEAWDISTGTSTVIVAVVDTGVAYEDYRGFEQAPDLANTSFVAGYDFINDDTHPNDDEGHGTHVTGTIAQSTNNDLGVAGIAFGVSIMPVKVLDQNGSGTVQTVADGIYFAADNGADIINLSLGWPVGIDPGQTVENAINYAYNQGVTIIAASGNEADEPGYTGGISYPAAYDNYVIAVGATRYDEEVSYYSNYGSSLDLTAPGGDVTVNQNEDTGCGNGCGDGVLQQTFGTNPKDWGYWFYQGTSMASPHVAGVAALLLSQDSSRTPDQIRDILQNTAEDKGDSGWDQYYGWGIIDAYAALTYSPVAISLVSPTTPGSVDFGILPLEYTEDTTSSGINDVETVSIDSGPADLEIKTSLFSDNGNSWTLGSSNGTNQVVWEYATTTPSWNKFLIADNLYPLASNVSQGNSQDIYFRLTMPTVTVSSAQYSSTVTIVATAP